MKSLFMAVFLFVNLLLPNLADACNPNTGKNCSSTRISKIINDLSLERNKAEELRAQVSQQLNKAEELRTQVSQQLNQAEKSKALISQQLNQALQKQNEDNLTIVQLNEEIRKLTLTPKNTTRPIVFNARNNERFRNTGSASINLSGFCQHLFGADTKENEITIKYTYPTSASGKIEKSGPYAFPVKCTSQNKWTTSLSLSGYTYEGNVNIEAYYSNARSAGPVASIQLIIEKFERRPLFFSWLGSGNIIYYNQEKQPFGIYSSVPTYLDGKCSGSHVNIRLLDNNDNQIFLKTNIACNSLGYFTYKLNEIDSFYKGSGKLILMESGNPNPEDQYVLPVVFERI